MQGIILAGGSGTRLDPFTRLLSKHFLLIYNKLLFFYPLSLLMLMGIKKINIISDPINISHFKNIIGLSKKGIDENFSTKGFISYYGQSKYFSERLIQEYCYNNNLNYIINRFGIIAGEYQLGKQDQGIISFWLKSFLKRKQLSYFGFGGQGLQVRDILNVKDLCRLIEKQFLNIKYINNMTFNVGGGIKNSISLKELTNYCQEFTGNKIKIKSIKKNRIYDIPYYVTNNYKIKKYYDWHPIVSPKKTIEETFNWLIKTKLF